MHNFVMGSIYGQFWRDEKIKSNIILQYVLKSF